MRSPNTGLDVRFNEKLIHGYDFYQSEWKQSWSLLAYLKSKVLFGAWVTVEDDDGNETTYQGVGPDEFDVAQHELSMDAPLAKAMIGKRWMMRSY